MCLGVPGRIVNVYDSAGLRMGKVDFGGTFREACLEYVPEAGIGDWTIIHVGFALSLLSESEASETLEMIRQMMDLADEMPPGPPSSDSSVGADDASAGLASGAVGPVTAAGS